MEVRDNIVKYEYDRLNDYLYPNFRVEILNRDVQNFSYKFTVHTEYDLGISFIYDFSTDFMFDCLYRELNNHLEKLRIMISFISVGAIEISLQVNGKIFRCN